MRQGQRLITESEWKEIKEYLNHCKDKNFVMKKTGRSRATIGRVKQSSTFREYERIRKGRQKGVTIVEQEQPDPVHEPEQISVDCIYANNSISILLDDISNKLHELSELIKQRGI